MYGALTEVEHDVPVTLTIDEEAALVDLYSTWALGI